MSLELAEALQRLGVSRVESLLVSHLHGQPVSSTEEIIAATGLRHPEVSVGMRALNERGWVEFRTIPREGKGRPMHEYHRSVAPPAMKGHYVALAQEAISNLQAALQDVTAQLGHASA